MIHIFQVRRKVVQCLITLIKKNKNIIYKNLELIYIDDENNNNNSNSLNTTNNTNNNNSNTNSNIVVQRNYAAIIMSKVLYM